MKGGWESESPIKKNKDCKCDGSWILCSRHLEWRSFCVALRAVWKRLDYVFIWGQQTSKRIVRYKWTGRVNIKLCCLFLHTNMLVCVTTHKMMTNYGGINELAPNNTCFYHANTDILGSMWCIRADILGQHLLNEDHWPKKAFWNGSNPKIWVISMEMEAFVVVISFCLPGNSKHVSVFEGWWKTVLMEILDLVT